MFDVGRLLVILWATVGVVRARVWLGVAVLAPAAYLFGLAVASGFSVRADGPMSPVMALLLAIVGPTALPRGELPPLPLAVLVLRAPAIADVLSSVALLAAARRIIARVEHLPQFAEASHRVSRAALALVLVAVFEGLAAALRLLPALLEWGIP